MRLLGFLIRSKQGPGFSRILSELVQGSDVQLSTVFNIAEGASGLELLPQALGSFFLRSLYQSWPLQSSVCCPCPSKHFSGCRNTDCVRMWPWARALLSLPSNPVFLKSSSEHPACESCGRAGSLLGALIQAMSCKTSPSSCLPPEPRLGCGRPRLSPRAQGHGARG